MPSAAESRVIFSLRTGAFYHIRGVVVNITRGLIFSFLIFSEIWGVEKATQ